MDLHLDDGSVEHEKGSPFVLHHTLKNDFPSVENAAYVGQQELTISIVRKNGLKDKYLEKTAAIFTNANYFGIFDYQWLSGNSSALNVPNTVVLTESCAKKYFGKESPIDKILKINNLQDVKVVGVLRGYPENTDLKTEVFISLPTIKTIIPDYGYEDWQWFSKTRETYISLKEGISKQSFEAQFPAFSKKYYGEMSKFYRFRLQPLADVHFDLEYGGKIKKSTILILALIGVLLVIIACINFVNLSTAQAFKRFKEIGVRKVLGSSQAQLFWQFILEIALITAISVALALLFAYSSILVINHWLKTQLTFVQFFDSKLLIFIPLLFIFIVAVAGFYPAWVILNFNPVKALKGISQGIGKGVFVRKGLVVTQFSISFVLISVSILVVLQLDFIKKKTLATTKI